MTIGREVDIHPAVIAFIDEQVEDPVDKALILRAFVELERSGNGSGVLAPWGKIRKWKFLYIDDPKKGLCVTVALYWWQPITEAHRELARARLSDMGR